MTNNNMIIIIIIINTQNTHLGPSKWVSSGYYKRMLNPNLTKKKTNKNSPRYTLSLSHSGGFYVCAWLACARVLVCGVVGALIFIIVSLLLSRLGNVLNYYQLNPC